MVSVKVRIVEIERCPACGGVALDKGETDAIADLKLAHVIEGGEVATAQHRQTRARCYECDRDMISLRGIGDVEYDWCDKCERMFFDRGELTALEALERE